MVSSLLCRSWARPRRPCSGAGTGRRGERLRSAWSELCEIFFVSSRKIFRAVGHRPIGLGFGAQYVLRYYLGTIWRQSEIGFACVAKKISYNGGMDFDLLTATRDKLARASDLGMREIASGAQVELRWLYMFRKGQISNPGILQVQRLAEFLTRRNPA